MLTCRYSVKLVILESSIRFRVVGTPGAWTEKCLDSGFRGLKIALHFPDSGFRIPDSVV